MHHSLINANSYKIPLANESIQCIVTSPPYLSLRSYDTDKNKDYEIGGENLHDCLGWATGNYCEECYVCHTLAWTREARRVLRNDGIMFINIGDSYNGSGGSGGDYGDNGMRSGQPKTKGNKVDILKKKDLIGVPWHIAFALQYDGWWLRNENIWYKPNAMPEGGAHDRFGRDHEQIFMFSKSAKYYFDKEAVLDKYDKPLNRWSGDKKSIFENISSENSPYNQLHRDRDMRPNKKGKGRRTVWKINTSGVGGTHYAKFPIELPEICIQAGTSEYGCCSKCKTPYKRIIDRKFMGEYNNTEAIKQQKRMEGVISGGYEKVTLGRTDDVHKTTTGWEKTCDCDNDKTIPCTILDPFIGSGTSLIAARNLRRNGIGLDLSFSYLQNDAKKRLGFTFQDRWENGLIVIEDNSKNLLFGKE